MTTRPVWTRGGLRLEIEVEKRPLPRLRQVWPLPPFGTGASDSRLILSLVPDATTGRNLIQVDIQDLDVHWPAKVALEHAAFQGPAPLVFAWEPVLRVGTGETRFNLPSPLETATHLFRLVQIAPERLVYPQASIYVPFSGGPTEYAVTPVTPATMALTVSNTKPA